MADTRLQYTIEINADDDDLVRIQKQILQLREKLVELRKSKLTLIDKEEIRKTEQEIKQLTIQLSGLRVEADKIRFTRVNEYLQQNAAVSSQAGSAIQSLNFVIRDSPYFFRDFSLGLLAIGNNLNPLIDSLIRAKLEAKAMNMTLGQALMQTLKGPNAVILGFSLLVAVIQGLTFAMAKSSEKTKEHTESLRQQEKQLRKLIQSYIEYKQELGSYDEIEELKQKLSDAIKEKEKKIAELEESIIAKEREARTEIIIGEKPVVITRSEEEVKKILASSEEYKELNKQLKTYRTELEQDKQRLTELGKVQTKYAEYIDRINKLKTGQISIDREIKELSKATNNEIRFYINYLSDLVDKTQRGTTEFNRLSEALRRIKDAFSELSRATGRGKKTGDDWLKQLLKEEEEFIKSLRNREREWIRARTGEMLSEVREGDFIDRLVQMYKREQEERIRNISEDNLQYIDKERAKFEEFLEKVKTQKEYEELIRKEKQLQLSYFNQIANSLDIINNKTKNWFSSVASILTALYDIAQAQEDIQKGKTSGTTGTLRTLSDIASIFATLKGLGVFASGGIVEGQVGRPVPIIAHSGEMILNKEQQKNLFNLIATGGYSRLSSHNIQITGNLKANAGNFVVEFQRALKIYNNSIKYA